MMILNGLEIKKKQVFKNILPILALRAYFNNELHQNYCTEII